MRNRKNPTLLDSKTKLMILIILSFISGRFLYIYLGTYIGAAEYKVVAIIISPAIIIWAVYNYFKEKKDDKKAIGTAASILTGSYFNSSEWQEEYIKYQIEHPFEKPNCKSMKSDLFSKYRNSEDLIAATLFFAFAVGCILYMISIPDWWEPFGSLVFLWLSITFFNDYTGKPVRKFLKRNIDYQALEHSYLNGKMVTYKHSGLIFGTTHIHIYKPKNVYAIDYRIVNDITRKVVRVKEYDNSIYTGNRYDHYAVVNVKIPESGSFTTVEVELNEYQVQMAIDEFHSIKYIGNPNTKPKIMKKNENHVST